MGRVLVAKTKYDDFIYDANTDEELHASALKHLKWNKEQFDAYWEEEDDKVTTEILAQEDGKRALRFLESRTDYEYEYIEVKDTH